MDDNVIGRGINWELRREMATAPKNVKHFAGIVRCESCSAERRVVCPVPSWAVGPPAVDCPICHAMAYMVDPASVEGDPTPYSVILVKAPDDL